MRRSWSIASLCILVLSANVGCSTLTKNKTGSKDSGWSISKMWKKEYQQPQQLAAIWTHDVLAVTGKAPTRGFGGRVYFYNERSQPIPVDGELIIHGFEEKPGVLREYTTESDKRFRFTAEQFTSHYSESELGASYSIWLPWDAAEGVQKEITLIPTFKSSKGQVVQGTAAKLVLPGKGSQSTGPQPSVQTVSFSQSQTPTVDGLLPSMAGIQDARSTQSSGMKTTTINLPSKTSQRLSNTSSYTESPNSDTQSKQYGNAGVTDPNAKVQAILDQLNMLNQSNSNFGTQPGAIGQGQSQFVPSGEKQSFTTPAPNGFQNGNSFGMPTQGSKTSGLPLAKPTHFGFK